MKRTTNNEQRTTDTERKLWRQAQELLDALEELPPDEHQAYLDRACPDARVREEVLAMLAVEEEAGTYLDRFASGFRPLPAGAQDLSGRRIGVYRLLKPIGRGGMGVVYEAERADGTFEQKVALKLLTTALAGTEAHQRFLAERRILAGLEHPAIARILDGGVTEDGTPWFAMEHVEGLPIDEYCDRHRLGIRERLELFLQVCDAVEHAHRRLVVHRDLKPTNILVTRRSPGKVEGGTWEQDDATSPTALRSQHRYKQRTTNNEQRSTIKLLDFGIAKLLEADESGAPTRTSLRLMTPEYASPEQVRGQEVTTASDVYQLGLLLYELLTGHRPYVFKRRNSAGELERVICEQPPTRLSAAITREGTYHQPDRTTNNEQQTTAFICQARRTSPSRLRRRLRGDLENIAGKALSKEPQRRYGSADRLAQDIRRHLSGLPVSARPDTWTYRGRKFLQRHALGTAASVVVLLTVSAMTGFHVSRVQNERDRAEVEAVKARQVSEFLTSLFRSVDPREARDAELTARELLDRGVTRVNNELSTQPEIRAGMLHVLGQTYLSMGMLDSAQEMLNQALGLRTAQLGQEHPDVAWILTDLGLTYQRQARYSLADQVLDEAIENLEGSSGVATERLATALLVQGENHARAGKRDEALPVLQRALEIQTDATGLDSPAAARIMHRLGALHWTMGELEHAESYFNQVIAIYEHEFGDDYPDIGLVLTDLANLLNRNGEHQRAEQAYRRSIAIQEKAYGFVHSGVGLTLNNLGGMLLTLERTEEASEILKRAYQVKLETRGPEYAGLALPLVSLGALYLTTDSSAEAYDAYRRAADVRIKALGTALFDPLLFYALVGAGHAKHEMNDPEAVSTVLEEALAVWSRAPDTIDPRLGSSLLFLGRWLVEQQRCEEATPILQRSIQIENLLPSPSEERIADAEAALERC